MDTQTYNKRIVDMTGGELIELLKQHTLEPPKEVETTDDGVKLLTIEEACKYLRISRPTLHNKMNNKSINYIKINRRTFIKQSELDDFLERNTI